MRCKGERSSAKCFCKPVSLWMLSWTRRVLLASPTSKTTRSRPQPWSKPSGLRLNRAFTMAAKTICTHNGSFHCDEALACWMLKQLPEYKDAAIVRTRDPETISKADIVVDVGAVYDPETHRYDHHQREFTGTFDDKHKTRLSSAGLVYKHFGRRVIGALVNSESEATIELLYQKLYNDFIEGIDGIDNGVNEYPTEVKANYKVLTDLGARVSWLNPAWNETGIDLDARFAEAMLITGHDFSHFVTYFSKSWLPARTVVESSLKERFNVHPSGEIIVLDQFCPWKGHLGDLEEEQSIVGVIKYAIFQDSGGSWRVQCMSVSAESFQNRKSLPEPWWGKRDAELSTLSGIPGCIFIHATGFVGGAQTKESTLKMAFAGLEAQ